MHHFLWIKDMAHLTNNITAIIAVKPSATCLAGNPVCQPKGSGSLQRQTPLGVQIRWDHLPLGNAQLPPLIIKGTGQLAEIRSVPLRQIKCRGIVIYSK